MWSENEYTICHFGLESGVVFEGTTECMNVFIVQFQMSKKEREICEFEINLKNFCLRSNLSNGNILSA